MRIKKIWIIGGLLVMCCFPMISLSAATFTVSASTSSVDAGGTFTVTVNVPGSGMFYFSGNNATVSQRDMYCDSSCSVTATAGSSGNASVTATTGKPGTEEEVTAFADDSVITGSKTVSVTIRQQTSTGGGNQGSSGGSSSGGTTETPQPTRSGDADLASLSVSAGTLTPKFSAGRTSYELSLPSDADSVVITAEANDAAASVSGAGEVALEQGENEIRITVTAEDGTTKTYTINAYVEEAPDVFLEYDGKSLGIVKNTDRVTKPGDAFEEVTLTIDGKEVTGWTNNIMNVTVLCMIDEESGEKGFYLYDSEQQALTSSFRPMTLLGNRLFVVDIAEDLQKREGMTFTTVTVDEQELPGWRYDEAGFDNYSLIYVMNEQGEMQYYQYEASQNTLQLYSNAAPVSTETYLHDRQIEQIAIIAAGVFAVTTIVALIGCVMIRRRSNLRIRQLHKKESE